MIDIQIQVCGTRTLNDTEFKALTDVLDAQLQDTPLSGATYHLAHYDWGKSPSGKFSGHINIDLVGGTDVEKDTWGQLTHWESTDRMRSRAQDCRLKAESLHGHEKQSYIAIANKAEFRAATHGKVRDYQFQEELSAVAFAGTDLANTRIQMGYRTQLSAPYEKPKSFNRSNIPPDIPRPTLPWEE